MDNLMKNTAVVTTLLALLFIGMVGGIMVAHFKVYPYDYFRNAISAADAVVNANTDTNAFQDVIGVKPPTPFDRYRPPARDHLTGLTRYDESLSLDGYTVYVDNGKPIKLIDMAGNVVHEWHIPSGLDELPRSDGKSLPTSGMRASGTYTYPNGDMLIVLAVRDFTPWGYGLLKIDKDSNPLWFFSEQVHHSVDVANNGDIYTLGHFVDLEPRPGLDTIETPFIDDTVVVLSPDGEKRKEVSILNAFRDSDYESALIYTKPTVYKEDLLHANSVQWIDPEIAKRLPFAKGGEVLISMRNMDVVAVLDIEQEKIVWAARGTWSMQHDAELLSNGNFLVFDNYGDIANGGSRVLEFNPQTFEVQWEFPGNTGETLFSSVKASQQRLPNGNTLITETNNGRLLEVTRDGEVAWEFYTPIRHKRGDTEYTKILGSQRIAADEINFEFNRLN